MKAVIVIPARYQSTRFSGKPLVDILGQSMIYRVWSRCIEVLPKELVYVATDSSMIADHCSSHGIQVVMTSGECLTGTDRLAEFAAKVDADVYINVQGDEPLVQPSDIQKVIDVATEAPDRIFNAMCDLESEPDYRSVTVPKVVCRKDGRLLYMSRAPIPTTKAHEMVKAKKQVCIYAFPKEALSFYGAATEKSPLEAIEDIEILRFLEAGYDVHMVGVTSASIAVDVPEDVVRVEEAIRETSR